MKSNKVLQVILKFLKDNNIKKLADAKANENFTNMREFEYFVNVNVPFENWDNLENYKQDFESLENHNKTWHKISDDKHGLFGLIEFPQITGYGFSFSVHENDLIDLIKWSLNEDLID